MPIVQLAVALRDMEIGEEVEIEATDAAFLADVRAWSRLTGNELEELDGGDVCRVRIRKIDPDAAEDEDA
ncbi:MAG: sulfurtransferase TusA family protein [Planctomycetes bacterium]|nr:sulfurtransferase TusA family protein [Planctomycetota bacterium]MCB9918447.1 sulfurtransferase TusA family protein [Planctomycetota bacterium]